MTTKAIAISDTPDHRERCADCGLAYEPTVRRVVRLLGDGRSFHDLCWTLQLDARNP